MLGILEFNGQDMTQTSVHISSLLKPFVFRISKAVLAKESPHHPSRSSSNQALAGALLTAENNPVF